MHPDYLEKVLNAQVYDVAIETPLEVAGNLSAQSVCDLCARLGRACKDGKTPEARDLGAQLPGSLDRFRDAVIALQPRPMRPA